MDRIGSDLRHPAAAAAPPPNCDNDDPHVSKPEKKGLLARRRWNHRSQPRPVVH